LQDLASNVWPLQSTLPVTLLSFSGVYNNGSTTLNWETENEVGFSHYEIERKGASGSFAMIANKQSKGNAGKSSYQHVDNISALTDEVVYYRLKMVDFDGKYKYSNTIMVRKEQKVLTGITINPNPVVKTNDATVRFQSAVNTIVTLRVIDMSGRMVMQQQNRVSEGVNSIPVNNLERLQPGIYIVQLQNGEELSAVKLSIVR
jgi:hypothetical protein